MVQVSIIANAGKSNAATAEGAHHLRCCAIHPSATADPTAALATVARVIRRCARRAIVDGEDQVARHAVLGSSGRDAVQTGEGRFRLAAGMLDDVERLGVNGSVTG